MSEYTQRVLARLRSVGPGQSDLTSSPRVSDIATKPLGNGRGKVFHTKAHERNKGEKYYTPAWVTRCLLRQVEFEGGIDEPAAGNGEMVRALEVAGYGVWASDIAPDAGTHGIADSNFLTSKNAQRRNIVTNPPFGVGGRLAFQFCWHATRLTERTGGKVAMLLRDDFDSAKGRRALFRDHPAFDRKVVITDRIRWTNLPQHAKKGPSGSHAWFIWDWGRADMTKPATLHYESADEDPYSAAITAQIDKVMG